MCIKEHDILYVNKTIKKDFYKQLQTRFAFYNRVTSFLEAIACSK